MRESGVYPTVVKKLRDELRTKGSVSDGIQGMSNQGRVTVLEYQPGNGKKYVVVLTEITPQDSKLISGSDRGAFIAYVHGFGRSIYLPQGQPVLYDDVRIGLGCNIMDAVVIAELLGHLTSKQYVSTEEFLKNAAG